MVGNRRHHGVTVEVISKPQSDTTKTLLVHDNSDENELVSGDSSVSCAQHSTHLLAHGGEPSASLPLHLFVQLRFHRQHHENFITTSYDLFLPRGEVLGGGTNRSDKGLNLSGSWQQGPSAAYNPPSRGRRGSSAATARPTKRALGGRGPLLRVGKRTAGACVASSPDSDLEAFSHNPAHGSFAPLAFQPSAMTNCANQRFLSAYGISQLVPPIFQTSINGKSKSQGVQRHQERQKQRLDAMEIGGGKSR
ncbi:hypothetical protein F511_39579 [Dorcoceras hygrometricum]|uniref:Uncharacterized protein n=1 Tax=Dorcoceras hygrometricum TaxID=472368 RepID=A0A2Z7AAH3_9LAMI|nr:hypothetical protein F511_39579 [Dorcoceras hygrometricum]